MNLLLLLSAILSALSGVGGSVRGGQPVQAVAQGVVPAATAVRVARRIAARPDLIMPTLKSVAALVIAAAPPRVTAAPLWASRRRE